MEPISTILTIAGGYILKAISGSKAFSTAKEDLLSKFWQWLRPFFIKDNPDIEKNPDHPDTEEKVLSHLMQLIKDEGFFNELIERVGQLQKAGIKEKNIVKKDIVNVKKIRIGDKMYSPDEKVERKNIVEGSVYGADEFVLGDGH
jgi:hypothetical protein